MVKAIKVKSILESLDYIQTHKASVARFGDGEVDVMMGRSIPYQQYDETLAKRLKEILQTPSSPDLLVCLPDVFRKLERYNQSAQYFWKEHFVHNGEFYDETCQSEWYGSTFLSRPYIDWVDKELSAHYFEKIKGLWDNRDLLIVEGETSRSGVGNDLFDGARSVQRLIAPSHHAFGVYDQLLDLVDQYGKNRLILLMLGPTAKLLAKDLSDRGHQAIDLGHIDSEYEWFQRGVEHKVKLTNKHTAEHNYDEEIALVADETYLSQIVATVGIDHSPLQDLLRGKGLGRLISVIIPIYNVEGYLPRCLDSLLAQTHREFEILLINDGSTDGTAKVAIDYAQKDSRIKVFHQKNAGPSAARNYGIELAQGDYITFVDGDDFVEKTYLERLYDYLVETGSDISAVNFSSFNEERQSYLFYQTKQTYFERVFTVQEWLDKEAEMKSNFHFVFTFSPMKLFKRSLFDKVRYPVGRLREDDATMYKLYLQANQIAFRNEGTYYYSQRSEGLSRQSMQTDVMSMVTNAEERLALLVSLGYDVTLAIKSYLGRLKKCQADALRMGLMEDYRAISLKLDLFVQHGKEDSDGEG